MGGDNITNYNVLHPDFLTLDFLAQRPITESSCIDLSRSREVGLVLLNHINNISLDI